MIVNEVKLNGKACNIKVRQLNNGRIMQTFGLCFYNGKDENKQTKYDFINCIYFGNTQLQDKQNIVIEGRLGINEYINKDHETIKTVQITVNHLEANSFDDGFNDKVDSKKAQENNVSFDDVLNDSIPFNDVVY